MTLRLETFLTRRVMKRDKDKGITRVEFSPATASEAPPVSKRSGSYVTHCRGGYDAATRIRYVHSDFYPVEPTELAMEYISWCREEAIAARGYMCDARSMMRRRIPYTGDFVATPPPPQFSVANPGDGPFVSLDMVSAYPAIYTKMSPDMWFATEPYALTHGHIYWLRSLEWISDPRLKLARNSLWGLMMPKTSESKSQWSSATAPHLTAAVMHVLNAVAQDAKKWGAVAWYSNDSLIVPAAKADSIISKFYDTWHLRVRNNGPIETWPKPTTQIISSTREDRERLRSLLLWSESIQLKGPTPLAYAAQIDQWTLRAAASAGAVRQ